MSEVAVSWNFHVVVDGFIDLGAWTHCVGLSAEYELLEYAEGGQNDFVHKLPGRLKYSEVELTRTVNDDSWKMMLWFTSLGFAVVRHTMRIAARNPGGQDVAAWNLIDAIPQKWRGPEWDTVSNYCDTETLVVAHQGFMPDFGNVPGLGAGLGVAQSMTRR